MIKRIKSLNDALPGLMLNIILLGVLCEAAGIWFVRDKAGYSIGLCLGILAAEVMAFHMAWALDVALDYNSAGAQKKALFNNFFRYGLVILLLVFIAATGFINPWAAFLGIMCLKAGAYLQPVTHKLYTKVMEKKINTRR